MDEYRSAKINPSEHDVLRFPEWQLPLQDLILEFDRAKLREKMQRVEALIYDRLQQLNSGSNGHSAEREAINDAVSILLVIKKDKLDYPDWK